MDGTVVWFILLAGMAIALMAYMISLDKLAKLYRPWRKWRRRRAVDVMKFTDYVDGEGKGYAVMDGLSWCRIRNPFELIFRHKKQIWQNDPRNVCRFFWIDGESIDAKNDIYLSYDAIHSIYGLVGRRG